MSVMSSPSIKKFKPQWTVFVEDWRKKEWGTSPQMSAPREKQEQRALAERRSDGERILKRSAFSCRAYCRVTTRRELGDNSTMSAICCVGSTGINLVIRTEAQ